MSHLFRWPAQGLFPNLAAHSTPKVNLDCAVDPRARLILYPEPAKRACRKIVRVPATVGELKGVGSIHGPTYKKK